MRTYTVQFGDSRWGIIAAAIGASRFPPSAVGAYADAMAALNPQVSDWTALAPGLILLLPA
jgi:hypothetical protein